MRALFCIVLYCILHAHACTRGAYKKLMLLKHMHVRWNTLSSILMTDIYFHDEQIIANFANVLLLTAFFFNE